MLKDEVRMKIYMNTITQNKYMFKGKTVLDAGCGMDIFSMFAVKTGAKRVVSIGYGFRMNVPLLLLLLLASVSSSSSSSCITRPSALSVDFPCAPTTEAALASCFGGDAALAAHASAHGFTMQHLTITNDKLRQVRVYYVDSVGREHDYGPIDGRGAVRVQETYPMHAWRVYDEGGDRALLLEMAPTGRVPPLRGKKSRSGGTVPEWHENMRFHEVVEFRLSSSDPSCASVYRRAPFKRVPMLNGIGLPHEGDIFGHFPDDMLSGGSEERTWPRPEAEHVAAKAQCLLNLDMHDASASYGASILYTNDDATSKQHLSISEMTHHIGSVVRALTMPQIEKRRRLDVAISRVVDVSVTLPAAGTASTTPHAAAHAHIDVDEIAQAAKETGLDFFDTVFLRIWIVGVESSSQDLPHPPRLSLFGADHGGDQQLETVMTAVAHAVDRNLILNKLARSWGLVSATWNAASCLRRAWAVALVEGITGPIAGLQQDWASAVYLDPDAGDSEGYARQLHGSWMPLLEANQAGVFAFTASAQNLYALHQKHLPDTPGLVERTIDHPNACDRATLLPPLITVAVRSDPDASRLSPDVFCGASNKRCGKEINREWRQRTPPASSSFFGDDEMYAKLRARAERSWAKSTGGVPWTEEDRRKRFVLDGLLNSSECEMLRHSGRKHMLSGASYSGRAKKDSASNNNHGAAFTIINADVSSDEAIAARLLFRDALSRVRSALMSYFNLTKLVCSNSQLSARYPPGMGHPVHSDDCIYRNDSGVCEPSNKVHECCVNYHFSAILFLNDQPEVLFDSQPEKQHWKSSRFYWHEKMGEYTPQQEIEAHWAYPRRTRVDNQCGRLVGFSAGEENPHGVESIAFGSKSVDFGVTAAGDIMQEDDVASWQKYARFALTNWFSTDERFSMTKDEPDFWGDLEPRLLDWLAHPELEFLGGF
jgi:hypothetical protein